MFGPCFQHIVTAVHAVQACITTDVAFLTILISSEKDGRPYSAWHCGPELMLTIVQELVCFEVLEEAIQAAALEADFTFPDDSASSNGDQSLIIDDIIESLESDALEAEQEALAVRHAEEKAQVGIWSCDMRVLLYN